MVVGVVLQASTNALVATLAVFVILVASWQSLYPVRRDFTETQLFTLASQSRQLVRNLQEPVKVWVTTSGPQDRQLLENYLRQGSQQLEYVDPQTRPGLADKFGVRRSLPGIWTATTVASGCE